MTVCEKRAVKRVQRNSSMLDAQPATVYLASPSDPSRNSKFGSWSEHRCIYFLTIVLSTIVAVGMNFDPTCRQRNLSLTTALVNSAGSTGKGTRLWVSQWLLWLARLPIEPAQFAFGKIEHVKGMEDQHLPTSLCFVNLLIPVVSLKSKLQYLSHYCCHCNCIRVFRWIMT